MKAAKLGLRCRAWHSTVGNGRNWYCRFKFRPRELLRRSSIRSVLDIYTQAITPPKHAAQAAVLSLVFSPEENPSSSLEAPAPTDT